MNRITDTLGGRKFAAFVASTIGLVALYVFGLELSESTLDAITTLYIAFASGNGVEHIARQIGTRRPRPPIEGIVEDILGRVSPPRPGDGS
jgi:uncharacterized protein YebE (UPF0316 family)